MYQQLSYVGDLQLAVTMNLQYLATVNNKEQMSSFKNSISIHYDYKKLQVATGKKTGQLSFRLTERHT